MNIYVQSIIAFTAVFLTDICWVLYIRRVKDGNPLKSAGWAAVLFSMGAVAVISYTQNPLLVIPSVVGAFLGTYVAVWWDLRKK